MTLEGDSTSTDTNINTWSDVCEENPDITIDSTNLALKPSWFTLDAMPSDLNCPALIDCNRTYSFSGFTGGEVVLSH